MRTPVEHEAPARPAAHSRRAAAWVSAALALVTALSGCSTCQHARRTLLFEPLDYGWKLDRGRSLKTYRRWATDAWQTERMACPEVASSSHYAQGFQDGFVDFIYAGGDGQPPPIPPRKFWNMAWRGPAGQAAANQWFAGFRRGAQIAQDGGYRQQATVESSFRTAAHHEWEQPMLTEPRLPIEELGPPGEPLPTPTPTLPEAPPGAVEAAPSATAAPDEAAPPADATPPAEPAPPADGEGSAQLFRRALDAAAAGTAQPIEPAASSGPNNPTASTSPRELPPADGVDPLGPADNESP